MKNRKVVLSVEALLKKRRHTLLLHNKLRDPICIWHRAVFMTQAGGRRRRFLLLSIHFARTNVAEFVLATSVEKVGRQADRKMTPFAWSRKFWRQTAQAESAAGMRAAHRSEPRGLGRDLALAERALVLRDGALEARVSDAVVLVPRAALITPHGGS